VVLAANEESISRNLDRSAAKLLLSSDISK
jgi:hypothetical protein